MHREIYNNVCAFGADLTVTGKTSLVCSQSQTSWPCHGKNCNHDESTIHAIKGLVPALSRSVGLTRHNTFDNIQPLACLLKLFCIEGFLRPAEQPLGCSLPVKQREANEVASVSAGSNRGCIVYPSMALHGFTGGCRLLALCGMDGHIRHDLEREVYS